MAVIGTAHVIIRAITDKLQTDVAAAFNNSGIGGAVQKAGADAGKNYRTSFQNEVGNNRGWTPPDIGAPNVNASGVTESLKRGAEDGARAAEDTIGKMDLDGPAGAAGERGGNALGRNFSAGVNNSGSDRAIQRILLAILALGPVVSVAVGALSSLISGLFALASAVAPAINALAILPGILGGLIQGIGGFALAFSGIGRAFKAGSMASAGAGVSAGKAAKAIGSATKRVGDITRQNAQATQAAAKAVKTAQRGVQDAYRTAAEQIISAGRRVHSAEDDLSAAQAKAAKAQKEVTQARIDAAEALQQLGFATRGAAIDEQQSLIALQRARENLARFMELPVDNRLRKEAQLAADEAQLNFEKIKDKASDLKKENEKESKAGVEGSKLVVDAKQKEADAQKNVQDAAQKLRDAQDAYAKQQVTNTRNIADAQDRLKEALASQSRTAQDNARKLADALHGVGAAGGAGSAGVGKFNTAMSKLSPQARAFVKYLLSIRGEFTKLKTAAGAELFPKLTTALKTVVGSGLLKDLGKGLKEAGSITGDTAISLSKLSTNSFFRGNFSKTLSSNNKVLKSFSKAVAPLVSALFSLTAAAAPVTEEFARWISIKAQAIAGFTGVGKSAAGAAKAQQNLRAHIQDGAKVAKQLGRIFSNLASTIFHLGVIARPAGQSLLNAFEGATKKYKEFANNPANAGKISGFFDKIAVNVRAIGRLFEGLSASFIRLGDGPGIAKVADVLRTKAVPVIEKLFKTLTDKVGPQLAATFSSILDAFKSLTDSPAFGVVLSIVKAFADAIVVLMSNPVTKQLVFFLLSVAAAFKTIALASKFSGLTGLVTRLQAISNLIKRLRGADKVVAGVAEAGGDAGGKAAAAGGAAPTGGGEAALRKQIAACETREVALKEQLAACEASGKAGAGGGSGRDGEAALRNQLAECETREAALRKQLAACEANGKAGKAGVAKAAPIGDAGVEAEKSAKGIGKLRESLNSLIPGFALLTGPILLVVAVVAGLIAIFVGAYKHSTKLQNVFHQIGTALKPLIRAFIQFGEKALKKVGDFIAVLIIKAVRLGTKALPYIKIAIQKVQEGFKAAQPFLKKVGEILSTMAVIFITKVVPAVAKFIAILIKVEFWIASKVIPVLAKIISTVVHVVVAIVKFGIRVAEVFASVASAVAHKVEQVVGFVKSIPGRISSGAHTMFNAIKTAISNAYQYVRDKVSTLIAKVVSIKNAITSRLSNAFNAIKTAIASAYGYVRDKVSALIAKIISIKNAVTGRLSGIFNGIKSGINTARTYVAEKIEAILKKIGGMKRAIATKARGMWDGIKSAFKNTINGVIGWWNGLKFSLPAKKIRGHTVFPGFTLDVPDIPLLAKGGTVAARPGGTLALLGEAGRSERVTPLGASGLSAGETAILNAVHGRGAVKVYIDVHPSPGMNEVQLAREVDRQLGWSLKTA